MEFYEENREIPFTAEEESKEPPKTKTEIQNYYSGKTILITGGTGFLGTLVIEKLLRSCPDLKKLIIILRPKRGKSLLQRANEHFGDEIYHKMKRSNPNYWRKIEIVHGDGGKPHYDLKRDEWNRLQTEVNVIFHVAATIRFDEHIRISYNINVAGTKYLLKLAEGAPNLDAFVYVSTAYSQSHLQYIDESFYPTPFTDAEMLQLLDQLDDVTLACMTPIILDGRFNTYVTTKSMAENIIQTYVGKLPVAVFRPSIVMATYEEPLVAWTNSIGGATGAFVGGAAGFLRTLYNDPNTMAEIVPADRVINALLTIPLHIRKQTSLQLYNNPDVEKYHKDEFVPIYNYVAKNRISWGQSVELFYWMSDTYREFKNIVLLWKPHLILEKNYTLWILEYYFLHLLPLPFFLLMEKLSKLPPRLWKGYIKLYNHTNLLSFFMVNSWTFAVKNASDLIAFTDEDDKKLFNADNNIDWKSYFMCIPKGSGIYTLKLNYGMFYERKHQIRGAIIGYVDKVLILTFKCLVFWLLLKMFQRLINGLAFSNGQQTI